MPKLQNGVLFVYFGSICSRIKGVYLSEDRSSLFWQSVSQYRGVRALESEWSAVFLHFRLQDLIYTADWRGLVVPTEGSTVMCVVIRVSTMFTLEQSLPVCIWSGEVSHFGKHFCLNVIVLIYFPEQGVQHLHSRRGCGGSAYQKVFLNQIPKTNCSYRPGKAEEFLATFRGKRGFLRDRPRRTGHQSNNLEMSCPNS